MNIFADDLSKKEFAEIAKVNYLIMQDTCNSYISRVKIESGRIIDPKGVIEAVELESLSMIRSSSTDPFIYDSEKASGEYTQRRVKLFVGDREKLASGVYYIFGERTSGNIIDVNDILEDSALDKKCIFVAQEYVKKYKTMDDFAKKLFSIKSISLSEQIIKDFLLINSKLHGVSEIATLIDGEGTPRLKLKNGKMLTVIFSNLDEFYQKYFSEGVEKEAIVVGDSSKDGNVNVLTVIPAQIIRNLLPTGGLFSNHIYLRYFEQESLMRKWFYHHQVALAFSNIDIVDSPHQSKVNKMLYKKGMLTMKLIAKMYESNKRYVEETVFWKNAKLFEQFMSKKEHFLNYKSGAHDKYLNGPVIEHFSF